jgi:hypothetical protein
MLEAIFKNNQNFGSAYLLRKTNSNIKWQVKVKQFRYRPGVAQRVPGS